MKYRKRPVVIDAYEYKGEPFEALEWSISIGDKFPMCYLFFQKGNGLFIHTLEGDMHVSEGDFIIKGVEGELYPCKPNIFHKLHEPVE